jgi:hypothetical protein
MNGYNINVSNAKDLAGNTVTPNTDFGIVGFTQPPTISESHFSSTSETFTPGEELTLYFTADRGGYDLVEASINGVEVIGLYDDLNGGYAVDYTVGENDRSISDDQQISISIILKIQKHSLKVSLIQSPLLQKIHR